jgi:hypothetical protein
MKYLISISIIICLNNFAYSQKGNDNIDVGDVRSNLSFGLTVGYKTDGGSSAMQIGYLIKHVVDFNIHYGGNHYEGGGPGIGMKFFILPKPKFKPYLGVTYDKYIAGGNGFSVGSDSLESIYVRGNNTVVLFHLGVLYEEPALSVFASLNYKTTFPGNYLILDKGPHNKGVESRAKQVFSPGLGLTVGIIFHWWGKKEKSLNNAIF